MKEHFRKFKEGFSNPFRKISTGLATSGLAFLFFLFTVFSANIKFSIQMLSSGTEYWIPAFQIRYGGLITASGYTGLLLTLSLCILSAVLIANTFTQLKNRKIDLSAAGAIPGFLAAGCASCGVGLLTFIGLGGVLASMPFQGNLLRLGTSILLVGLITRNGSPEKCYIE